MSDSPSAWAHDSHRDEHTASPGYGLGLVPAPITAHDAIRLMREVVAEAGSTYQYVKITTTDYDGHPYTGCVYIDRATGDPSCLIGRILARHGFVLAEIPLCVKNLAAGCLPDWVCDPKARSLLAWAQGMQDNGERWGAILADSEERFAGKEEARFLCPS